MSICLSYLSILGTKAGALTTPGSNEPLFRKARLAQHLKEMVKVPLTTQANEKQGPGAYGRYGGGYDDNATISTTKSAPSGLSSLQQTTVGGVGGHPNHAPYPGGSNSQGGMNSPPGTISSANYTGPTTQNYNHSQGGGNNHGGGVRVPNTNSSSGKSLRIQSGNTTIATTTVTQPYDHMNVNNHKR